MITVMCFTCVVLSTPSHTSAPVYLIVSRLMWSQISVFHQRNLPHNERMVEPVLIFKVVQGSSILVKINFKELKIILLYLMGGNPSCGYTAALVHVSKLKNSHVLLCCMPDTLYFHASHL